jgi:DNA-binding transcriptional regulator YdaS (Cro superfamily)
MQIGTSFAAERVLKVVKAMKAKVSSARLAPEWHDAESNQSPTMKGRNTL